MEARRIPIADPPDRRVPISTRARPECRLAPVRSAALPCRARTAHTHSGDGRRAMATVVDDLRYPVGRYTPPDSVDAAQRAEWIGQIAAMPARLHAAVAGLTEEQLDTPYRPGGWTVRQVVHHVPDSHMNAFVRMKLALTEDVPPIKTVRRSRVGAAPRRHADAHRDVAGAARRAARALGAAAARADATSSGPRLPPPGMGRDRAGSDAGPLRVAQPPPRGAHHGPARARGLVGTAGEEQGTAASCGVAVHGRAVVARRRSCDIPVRAYHHQTVDR